MLPGATHRDDDDGARPPRHLRLVAAGRSAPRRGWGLPRQQAQATVNDAAAPLGGAFFVSQRGLGVADPAAAAATGSANQLMCLCEQRLQAKDCGDAPDASALLSGASLPADAGESTSEICAASAAAAASAVLAVLQPGNRLAVAVQPGGCRLLLLRAGCIIAETPLASQLQQPDLLPTLHWQVQAGDVLIAGTDGLFDSLTPQQIIARTNSALVGVASAAVPDEGGDGSASNGWLGTLAASAAGGAAATETEQLEAAMEHTANMLAREAARQASSRFSKRRGAAWLSCLAPPAARTSSSSASKADSDIIAVVALVTEDPDVRAAAPQLPAAGWAAPCSAAPQAAGGGGGAIAAADLTAVFGGPAAKAASGKAPSGGGLTADPGKWPATPPSSPAVVEGSPAAAAAAASGIAAAAGMDMLTGWRPRPPVASSVASTASSNGGGGSVASLQHHSAGSSSKASSDILLGTAINPSASAAGSSLMSRDSSFATLCSLSSSSTARPAAPPGTPTTSSRGRGGSSSWGGAAATAAAGFYRSASSGARRCSTGLKLHRSMSAASLSHLLLTPELGESPTERRRLARRNAAAVCDLGHRTSAQALKQQQQEWDAKLAREFAELQLQQRRPSSSSRSGSGRRQSSSRGRAAVATDSSQCNSSRAATAAAGEAVYSRLRANRHSHADLAAAMMTAGQADAAADQAASGSSGQRLIRSRSSPAVDTVGYAAPASSGKVDDTAAAGAADILTGALLPGQQEPLGVDSRGAAVFVGSRVAVLADGSSGQVVAVGVVSAGPGQRLNKYQDDKVPEGHVGVGHLRIEPEMQPAAHKATLWSKQEGLGLFGRHPGYTFWSKRDTLQQPGVSVPVPSANLLLLV